MTSKRFRWHSTVPAVLCVIALMTTGCIGEGDKVKDLPKVPRTEALRMVDDYANRTVALLGGEAKLENPGSAMPPCEGPDGETTETVYYAAGHYQIAPVPEELQLATLRRLRDQFRQQGYTIKRDRVFPDGKTGELAVISPTDEFEIHLESTDPPTAFALMVSSPCYQFDETVWPGEQSPTSNGP